MALEVPQQLLTVADVAGLLRVSGKTVLRMIRAGKLPASKVNRQWRISVADYRAWIDQATQKEA